MKRFDYFFAYNRLAPLQLSLIRFEEAYWTGKVKMAKPILDIGCNDGVFGQILFKGKKGAIKIGLDKDGSALARAKERTVSLCTPYLHPTD